MEKLKWLTPKCCKDKRNYRIKQAKKFDKGTDVNNQVIINLSFEKNIKYGFGNPGKDDGNPIKNSKKKRRDMTPFVEAKNNPITTGEFKNIWGVLLTLQQFLDKMILLKLYRLIYRLAFMVDFEFDENNKTYVPNNTFINDIQIIQEEINKAGSDINIKSFIMFLDLLGWNEDYKYQLTDDVADSPWKGRLNCLICMISVPIELNKLNIKKGEKINFDSLLEMCYAFCMSRGIFVLSKSELIKELELEE